MLKLDWEAHPVTVKLRKVLNEAREVLIDRLTKGYLLNNPSYERISAYNTGMLEGLAIALEADLIDKEEDDKENK